MPTKANRAVETWTYVLLVDRELAPNEQSRFTLSPLTVAERAKVHDAIARVVTALDGSKTVLSSSQSQGVEITLGHIVSVENFPVGEPQPWPSSVTDRRKYLEMLQDDYIQELANEVWEKSAIGLDVKNF